MHLKMGMGMTSGGIGSFVGCPSEVALVRMGADSRLPVDQRRNYKNVVDCVVRMFKEEGIQGPWRGAVVTVQRAMVRQQGENGERVGRDGGRGSVVWSTTLMHLCILYRCGVWER